MEFNWNDIYQDFLSCKERACFEREFQNCIYSVFRYYLRWQNCIVAEETIPIGAANAIRPDFVLYKDEVPQVVIESKEPNHSQISRNREQLFSYMRQKKVDFGLYIGENIQLYYDVPDDVELPILIFTLEYGKDAQFGDDFVALFNRIDFDKNELTDYCLKRIQSIQKEQQLEKDVQLLLSEEGKTLCNELLRTYFISKGYSQPDIDAVLGDIEIVVKRKNSEEYVSLPINGNNLSSKYVADKEPKNRKRQMYSVNGSGAYCKNRSALELVKRYITDHPLSYRMLQSIFAGTIPNYILSKDEVEAKKNHSLDRNKAKRWFEDSPLVSSDGVSFYVTTQVGDNCPIDFKDIVSLAEKLGYKIEPIT